MYKLVIVDDEPLVLVGMETLLDYSALGIEIVGTASNGQKALELIKNTQADIVIADIKMPVMDGLELVEECNRSLENPPQFIILTSFEEFDYVRRALRANVVDYIVKMELDANILTKTLKKAVDILNKSRSNNQSGVFTSDVFINRFLNKLLNNVFHSEVEINEKLYSFNLDFSGVAYLSVIAQMDPSTFHNLNYQESYDIYTRIINMSKLVLSKYVKGYVVANSQTTFSIIMSFKSKDKIKETCKKILNHIRELSINYFNVPLKFGIGSQVDSLLRISCSFYEAQNALEHCIKSKETMTFFSPNISTSSIFPKTDIIELNQQIINALEAYDYALFSNIIEKLTSDIKHDISSVIEGFINITSGIIHLIINNLDDGERLLHEAFDNYPKSYQCIYSFTEKEELIIYLKKLSKFICTKLKEQKDNPQNKIVVAAKDYIKKNIYKRLTLNDVAKAIDISPNYLSSIFKKNSSHGFNEYVTIMKIRKARELLLEKNLKVYEVSDMLGFTSPYYFSTVYKKVTGLSPTESIELQKNQG